MKATLPNGTTLEGTPEELAHFIDKPQPCTIAIEPTPLPYIPTPAQMYPWPYTPTYPTITW